MSHKTERRRNSSTGRVGSWSFPWFEELQSSVVFPTDLPNIWSCHAAVWFFTSLYN